MLIAGLLWVSACAPELSQTPLPVDLLRELPRADRAPAAESHRLITVEVVSPDGSPRPALVMRASSRVIWHVQMTEAAELRTTLARVDDGSGGNLSVRLGVSDGRLYEDVYWERALAADGASQAWQPLVVDLSPYSGWKWSVFYRPARRVWLLILNVQGSGTVALAEPVIVPR